MVEFRPAAQTNTLRRNSTKVLYCDQATCRSSPGASISSPRAHAQCDQEGRLAEHPCFRQLRQLGSWCAAPRRHVRSAVFLQHYSSTPTAVKSSASSLQPVRRNYRFPRANYPQLVANGSATHPKKRQASGRHRQTLRTHFLPILQALAIGG